MITLNGLLSALLLTMAVLGVSSLIGVFVGHLIYAMNPDGSDTLNDTPKKPN